MSYGNLATVKTECRLMGN